MEILKTTVTDRTKLKQHRLNVPKDVRVKLWVRAGGICSLRGCRTPLEYDQLTLSNANFSNVAHIVAHSVDGPRGQNSLALGKRNDYENLILLCMKCHHLIDSSEYLKQYTVDVLHEHKRQHEEQFQLTRALVGKMEKTQIVRCRANVLSETVQISTEEIVAAILPRFPVSPNFIDIDLTRMPGTETSAYWQCKKEEISAKVNLALSNNSIGPEINHLCVFAMGPIPLLAHLGNCLSNKIVTDFYQRHRDTENWVWKDVDTVEFEFNCLRKAGTGKVILLLSLSGKIFERSIPEALKKNECSIYEITLKDLTPNPHFLNSKSTLNQFKRVYREALSLIAAENEGVKTITLLPAVPAPIAVLCGRELIHKADPVIAVYDFNKNNNVFEFALEVNCGLK